jgi:hypothetical protein
MIRRIIIPPVNEHKFVTYDDIIEGTRYNQHQFDRAWLSEQVRDWQDKRDYAQKKQFKDKCSVQISALPDSVVSLILYKCDHTVFDTYPMQVVEMGNADPMPVFVDDIEYNAYWYFNAKFWQNVLLTEGRYYFVIEIVSGSDTDRIISEPIELKEKHPNTVLHEYTNRSNKDLCIFEQTGQKFSLRVSGDVLNLQPKVERISFLDHRQNTTELSAVNYRGWTVYAGTRGGGIPDYEFDILNYAWGLTSKRVEGKGYTVPDGGEWVKDDGQGSILTSGSIDVREANIDDAYRIIKGSFTVIPSTPYPWVNMFVSIGKDGIKDFYYPSPTYITNDATRDQFIDDLSAAAVAQGLDGEFSLVGSNIDYELGPNETYDQSSAPILTKFIQINSITTGSSQNLNLYIGMRAGLNGGKSPYAFINASGSLVQGEYFSGNSIYPITSGHVAGAAGTYSSYLFHDDTLSLLEISGDYLRSFTGGKFPELLKSFKLFNSPRIIEFFIFTSLMHCANSLEVLNINNNITLANIQKYSDYTVGTIYGNSMKKLNIILLRQNNQTSTNLNAMYNSMKNAMLQIPAQFTVFNGIMDTSLQISGAQPTNFPATLNSSQARSMLINTYQWTVII